MVAVVVVVGAVAVNRMSAAKKAPAQAKTEIQEPVSKTDINRDFEFPLKNAQNKVVSKIKFTLQNAELRNEIVVKGQKAQAVTGRKFLILNLKISNDFNRSIQIDSRDYVRLAVKGKEEEWLAPEIHNDPVEAQAISVKYTRLGFAVDDNQKNFILQVGEINQDKEKIELNFK